MRRVPVSWALLLLVGCRFEDRLPASLVVTCGPNGECPTGRTCNIESNECRVESTVGEAPKLSATVPTPAMATRGATVSFDVSSTVALRQAPRLVLRHSSGTTLAPAPTKADADFTRASYSITIDDQLGEGLVTIFADAVSVPGASVNGVKLETFIVDTMAPVLRSSAVTPRVATRGTTIAVHAEFNEVVSDDIRLSLVPGPGAPEQLVQASSNVPGLVLFSFDVPGNAPDGNWALTLINVKDLAGNTLAPTALPSLTVDSRPPTISALGLQGHRYSAQPGFNSYSIPIVVDEPAAVKVCVGSTPCQTAMPGTNVVVTVNSADTEGPQFIVVRAVDAAGNEASLSESVVYDFTPPGIAGTVVEQLTPPAGCLLPAVTALTRGATHRLQFAADEALSADPLVTSGPLSWSRVTSTGANQVYTLTVPSTAVSQSLALMAHLVDSVGNVADVPVRSALTIDLDAPATLTESDQDKVLYERVPWGAQASAYVPRYSVTGAAGLLQADESLVFFDGSSLNAQILGQARAEADGSVSRVVFARGDRQQVWLQRFDGACNVAAGPVPAVKNVEWVATTGQPVGSPPNPHVMQRRESGAAPAEDGTATATVPLWAQRSPTQAETRSQWGQWTPVEGFAAPAGLVGRSGHSMTWDALRGRLVVFGGSASASLLNDTWVLDGNGWSQVLSPLGLVGRTDHSAAYDPRGGRIIVFGGNSSAGQLNDTWALDGTGWTQLPTPPALTARFGAALAFDVQRSRLVLFGGNGISGYLDDTWVLDDTGWTRLPTAHPPTPRNAPAMVYDAARGRMVLFGGQGSSGPLNDTWVLGDSDWTRLSTPGGPPGRFQHTLTYDPLRSRVVLFGGSQANFSNYLNDTWVLDGSGWSQVTTPSGLVARNGHSTTWDAVRGRLVMFGGFGPSGLLSDTWALDGAGWTQLSNGSSLVARSQPTLTYDPLRDRMVLFGGQSSLGPYLNEAWALDGSSGWVRLSTRPSLGARSQHTMSWDALRNRMVMFGGNGTTGLLNDTWAFAENGWAQASTPPTMVGRSVFSMAYDSLRGRTVVFGGYGGSGITLNDTWVFDGIAWTRVTTPVAMAGRIKSAMAFDSQRGRMVLMGGSKLNDTWVLDGTGWSQVAAPLAMMGRQAHSMAFDPMRVRMVLFGGDGATGAYLNDTWIFDGNGWTALATPSAMVGRFSSSMAWDARRGRMVLFGGFGAAGPLNDTWALDSTGWTQLPTPMGLVARSGAALSWDAERDRLVLFGGQGSSGQLNDTWVLDGTGWTQVSTPPSVTARQGHTMAYDPMRRQMLLFGGVGASGLLDDTQVFATSSTSGPANVVRIDTSTLLPADAVITSVTPVASAAGRGWLTTNWLVPGALLLADGGVLLPDGGVTSPTITPVSGVRLETWDRVTGQPIVLAQHGVSTRSADGGVAQGSDGGAVAAQVADVTVTLSQLPDGGAIAGGNSALLQQLIVDKAMRFQVTTKGGADNVRTPFAPAEIATDYFEVRVRYRVP